MPAQMDLTRRTYLVVVGMEKCTRAIYGSYVAIKRIDVSRCMLMHGFYSY